MSAYERLARQLDHSQIAGMVCREYPDNSVVCHARRLAGLPQDNFVSGSARGVRCDDVALPFFPDIYNEDWFFFSKAVARHDLFNVGYGYRNACMSHSPTHSGPAMRNLAICSPKVCTH